ncbi:MAG: hypothetical protein EBZ91_01630, partial [Gammaproteobacteria bacterium]|nr:hypothetical protein [Gammaproteobacteria bacterium]
MSWVTSSWARAAFARSSSSCRHRRLQGQRLFEILPQLGRSKLLRPQVIQQLDAAYRYLRTLENRLQMLRDAQTHSLPLDESARDKLARAMGELCWADLTHQLQHHLDRVQREFNALVFAPIGEREGGSEAIATARTEGGWTVLWDEATTPETLREWLRSRGLDDAEDLARLLVDFRDSAAVRRLDAVATRRLQLLLPELLAALSGDDECRVLVMRILRVLEAIGGRSSYFALLNENPVARARFLTVCRGGDFLVQQL